MKSNHRLNRKWVTGRVCVRVPKSACTHLNLPHVEHGIIKNKSAVRLLTFFAFPCSGMQACFRLLIWVEIITGRDGDQWLWRVFLLRSRWRAWRAERATPVRNFALKRFCELNGGGWTCPLCLRGRALWLTFMCKIEKTIQRRFFCDSSRPQSQVTWEFGVCPSLKKKKAA